MPQQSRYSNAEFEALMNEIILTLEKNQADRDLSLMVLAMWSPTFLIPRSPPSIARAW